MVRILMLFYPLMLLAFTSSEGKHFLWKVSDQNSHIYILGSIHVAKTDFYPLHHTIEEAFNESEYLAIEVDITDPAAEMFLYRSALLPETSIKEVITKARYIKLSRFLHQKGIAIDGVAHLKPWAMAQMIMLLRLKEHGILPALGIDEHFISRAKTLDKKIVGLETLASQINLLDSLTYQEQQILLDDALINDDTFLEEFDRMAEAWRDGDTERFTRITLASLSRYQEIKAFTRRLIIMRNETMSRKIEKFLEKDQEVFVVIGSAHLVGEKSVIELLGKHFRVEQK